MSTDDNIFVVTNGSLDDVGSWLSETLGCEAVNGAEESEPRFATPARGGQGTVYLTIEPNVYGTVNPAPDEVSAIDRYKFLIDVYYPKAEDEAQQEREAQLIFEDLAGRAPRLAMILSHNLALMTAAYLPDAGVRRFPRGTTLDVEDIQVWRPWVVG